MWENMVEPVRPQMAWHMRIPCRLLKATNTHSEYVILIAFPLQQWLHNRASVLRYTYIARLVAVLVILGGVAILPLLTHVIYLDTSLSPVSVKSQAVKLRPRDVH
jgi:hypothetical protein